MPLLTELTPDWLKNRFLVGVDLTLDDGTAYPDTIFEQSIASAISYIEHEIGLCLDPFTFSDEAHDAYGPNRSGWWPFRLDHRPVIKVTGLNVQYGAFPAQVLPVSWVQLPSEIHAQIHLIPSADSIDSAYKFSRGVPMITADVIQPERYIPGYFRFSYQAGFETRSVAIEVLAGQTEASVALDPPIRLRYTSSIDAQPLAGITATVASRGTDAISIALSAAAPEDATYTVTLSTLPADIKQAIGYKASLLPLDVAGDLIAGAGIATMHIGVDGLSQSLGTTACLHADTRIALSDGSCPTIKSLVGVPRFTVACVDSTGAPVRGIGHSARKTIEDDVISVNLSNGESVLCNASHLFRQGGGGYIPAGELRSGVALTPCSLTTDAPSIAVLSIAGTGMREWLYDITVDEHHCFGLAQGVIVHNSATNAGYGARVLQFERELKAMLPALRAKYRMMNIGVI